MNPKLVLIGSLILGIGGWMVTLANWSEALTPVSMGGLLMIVGGVFAPSTVKSIFNKGEQK